MNGLLILDYMLASRKDIDTSRIGTNGGSGGGTHTVLLSVLDDRFTASAPVVSLASHFDGVPAKAECLFNYLQEEPVMRN